MYTKCDCLYPPIAKLSARRPTATVLATVHCSRIYDSATVGLEGEDDASSTSIRHDIDDGLSRGNAFDIGSRVESKLRKCETTLEAIQGSPAVECRNEVQLSSVTARVPKASDDMETRSKTGGSHLKFFTLKELSSCIMASENTRVFCSIMTALAVVLSYINLPRSIVKSKNIIASRPLYVLLLTDVTIVIVRLALEKRRVSDCSTRCIHRLQFLRGNHHLWPLSNVALAVTMVSDSSLFTPVVSQF